MEEYMDIGKKLDKRFYIIIAALLLAVAAIISINYIYGSENIGFNREHAVKFNDNWQLSLNDKYISLVNLPTTIEADANDVISIKKRLPKTIAEGNTVCIRSSLQGIQAFIDGELIYEYGTDTSKYPGHIAGSAWVVFRLPQDSASKFLTLKITSNSSRSSGIINDIYLQTKTSIMFSILKSNGLSVFICFVTVFLSLIMILIHCITTGKYTKDYSLIYLSVFTFLVALWILGESKMLQFIIGNQHVVSNLSFYALYLFPLPMTLFVDTGYERHHKRFAHVFFWLFLINFVICTSLVVLNVTSFIKILLPCQLLIISFVVLSTAALIFEWVKYRNKTALTILIGNTVLFSFGLMDFYFYFFSKSIYIGKFMSVGLLIYSIYLQTIAMIRLHKMNEQGIQSEYYKWLAFIDPLTHGFNRSAFERDSKRYFNNEMKDSWLFILDLNNLKSINDTIGHKSGDDAIKNVFKCLVDSFGHDSYVYRMGGDEFACILPNSCAEAAIERVTYFYDLMETKNLSLPYNLSAAIGYSEFIADKWETFDEFFSYVDNLMYENKQIMKKEKSCSK